ncbi:MAG: hypothetical protein GF399_00850 [Candidatus Coatesbacteria bacterium]|nr:hypothetical protein [Candidatus Coatesbacteria bacterium]
MAAKKKVNHLKGCLLSFCWTGALFLGYVALQLGIGYWASSLLLVPLACIGGFLFGGMLAKK